MLWIVRVGNQTVSISAPTAAEARRRIAVVFPGISIRSIREGGQAGDASFRLISPTSVDQNGVPTYTAESPTGPPTGEVTDPIETIPPVPIGTDEPADPFTELIGTAAGRESLFQREIAPQARSGSGFLRRGLERGFAPTEQAFLLQALVNQPENALNFAQFLPGLGSGAGRGVPTTGGIQAGINALLRQLQFEEGDPRGPNLAAREFIQTGQGAPGNQFNLAFAASDRARNVLPFLRGAFQRGARRLFEQRRLDEPGELALSGFAERGFRF